MESVAQHSKSSIKNHIKKKLVWKKRKINWTLSEKCSIKSIQCENIGNNQLIRSLN